MSGTISQRELRNDNADVMRRVETGESFVVTRRGVPVADLVPHREDGDRRETFVPTSEIVAKAPKRPGLGPLRFRHGCSRPR